MDHFEGGMYTSLYFYFYFLFDVSIQGMCPYKDEDDLTLLFSDFQVPVQWSPGDELPPVLTFDLKKKVTMGQGLIG